MAKLSTTMRPRTELPASFFPYIKTRLADGILNLANAYKHIFHDPNITSMDSSIGY